MAKRSVLKITPVLIALNILVLIVIAGFYTVRLVKYYNLENGQKEPGEASLLVDTLKKKQSYLDDTKGLVYNEETGVYTFKGYAEDNYVKYSGMIYRILSIDNENNIKMVSESNVTLLYPELKNGYEKSSVNKWLNVSDEKFSGVYEKALVDVDNMLINTTMCNDVIDDVSNITCDSALNNYKVSLLSLHDYKIAGGKESFLNNGDIFYLGTLNTKNDMYYVTSDGEIALNEKDSKAITLKPVITLAGNTVTHLGGNGSEERPYVIEKHEIKTIGDAYVNNYVKINDNLYKIIEKTSNKVKLTSVDVIQKNDKPYAIKFGGSTSEYSTTNTVGKYLNNTFLNSLDIKDYVVNGYYYTGSLSLTIGLLTIGDMFVNETTNTFTLLRGMEAPNIINVINENGNIFADTISAKYNVRPAFYIKSDLEIINGKGTEEIPYELGVKNGDEESTNTSTETKTEG